MEKVYEIFDLDNKKRVCKNEQYQKQIDGTYKKLPSAYRFKTYERAVEIAERNNITNYKIMEKDRVPLQKVIDYCINKDSFCCNCFESVDMEYNNETIIAGYWWIKDKFDNLKMHPVVDFIEANYDGVLVEWNDEWATCCECYRGIKTNPSSYGWEPSFITTDYGYVCHECCKEDPEYLIEEYMNDFNRAIPNWAIKLIENEGFKCLEDDEMTCSRFQNGFHYGMNDTPEKIIKEIEEEFELKHINDLFDYIFAIASNSQFYVDFTIFLRKIKED